MNEFIEIEWKDLQVGDEFEDGSIVKEITPWDERPCYEMVYQYKDEDPSNIIVSDHHLFKSNIYLLSNNQIMNDYFIASESERNAVEEKNNNWITMEDLYLSWINNNKYLIKLIDIEGNEDTLKIINITPYKNLEPQTVRCIRTTTGYYVINNIVNHNTGTKEVSAQQNTADVIMHTFDAWSSSPIIQKMRECETTEEMRNTLYEELKQQYKNAGIKQDDFNIMMAAKKMTSYKRGKYGLRPVEPGERCDIVSLNSVGNHGNIFKTGALVSSYRYLTKPIKQTIKPDAANEVMM